MFKVLVFWYILSVFGIVYVCAFTKAKYSERFWGFLTYSKNLPAAYGFEDSDGLHPAGCFDFDEIHKYYLENYNLDLWNNKSLRKEIGELLNIYCRLGVVKRQIYWNHYIYRVR